MSKEAAARRARQEVDARWTRKDFAAKAKLDVGTVSDFLDGLRWPRGTTRARIEEALEWPVGSLQDIAEGSLVVGPYVGPKGQAVDFVPKVDDSQPGRRATLTDDEVLALIRENRRLADELERRITGGNGP